MLNHLKAEDLLFLDIETVPQSPSYEETDPLFRKLWDKKASFLVAEGQEPADVYQRAGIYAEFGRIICISVGLLTDDKGSRSVRLKSFAGEDEKALLLEFAGMLEKYARRKAFYLCAHNGKEFDFPYISRRMLINGIPLPDVLDNAGKKPWEVNFVDTMELWKFGDFKNYTSLELLAAVFGIPTPKDDIDGSQVAGVFYEEKNLARIVTYCEKDVVTIIQVFLRFKGEEMIPGDRIVSVGG
jgi:DNA polymerase elongation subunit (family B)